MATLAEIRRWSTARIFEEIKDQKEWIRETRRVSPGFPTGNATDQLYLFYKVLDERNNRR